MAKILRVDVETFSSIELKKAGAARYVSAPDFEIMLFAFKWIVDGVKQPTRCVDLWSLEEVPPDVMAALTDPTIKKTAFNAAFELLTIGAHWPHLNLDPSQWECTMVHALHNGLPGNLADVCKVLKTTVQKDFRGSSLIQVFCKPVKATKKNGKRTRNLPTHDPARWELFKRYNIVDVDSEDEVADRLASIPMPAQEWRYWLLDQRMNERGVRVDKQLVENAIALDAIVKERLTKEAMALTGLSNPNSVKQLKAWLTKELDDGEEITSLSKETIPKLIDIGSAKVGDMLRLRQQLGKTSVTKYHAMLRSADGQGYIRGLTQFYGANRTGRAAGRLVQLQNLRKNAMATEFKNRFGEKVKFDELALAREILRDGDFDLFQFLWGDPLDVLSQLVRTAIVPDDGCIFAPVDFNAIEARKLAWAANCKWRLDVFTSHGLIYETSAAKMFKVPLDSIVRLDENGDKIWGPNRPMRAKGKISELALGYQGGEGALIRMGALDMGLELHELDPIKVVWRAANLEMSGRSYKDEPPGFWERMEEAALRCVMFRTPQAVDHGIEFRYHAGVLFMRLPSGRELCYCKPSVQEGDYGPQVWFWGQNQVTKQWEKQSSYGGRWTENFCQASSRDLLYFKLARLEDMGLHHAVRFHVHDEAVPSIPIHGARDTLKRIEEEFGKEVYWAPGLPLRGDGFLTPFFRKDD